MKCKTVYESSCTTRYIEKQPGKFVGDTKCEKLPIELCGQGCRVVQGPEECHDKNIDTVIDVPEEVCDLNPQKTCRTQTRLVPQLKPEHECTTIPQEVCQLKFGPAETIDKPLMTKWCIDPAAEVVPGETYDESDAAAPPVTDYGSESIATPQNDSPPPPPPPSGVVTRAFLFANEHSHPSQLYSISFCNLTHPSHLSNPHMHLTCSLLSQ